MLLVFVYFHRYLHICEYIDIYALYKKCKNVLILTKKRLKDLDVWSDFVKWVRQTFCSNPCLWAYKIDKNDQVCWKLNEMSQNGKYIRRFRKNFFTWHILPVSTKKNISVKTIPTLMNECANVKC